MCSEYIQSIFDYCQVDVAVIQYDDTVSSTYMAVAIANTSSPPTFLDVVALNYTQTYLVVGMGVRKVGKTTGQTDGGVTNTCVTARWEGYYLVPCSVTATYASSGGDSGSPVYQQAYQGYPARPAGMHIGSNGSTKYFNYISWIESALGWKYYFY